MYVCQMWAKVSALRDVKCSGNWMWAAKLPGEGAAMFNAATALSSMLIALGMAIDGGKDRFVCCALDCLLSCVYAYVSKGYN